MTRTSDDNEVSFALQNNCVLFGLKKLTIHWITSVMLSRLQTLNSAQARLFILVLPPVTMYCTNLCRRVYAYVCKHFMSFPLRIWTYMNFYPLRSSGAVLNRYIWLGSLITSLSSEFVNIFRTFKKVLVTSEKWLGRWDLSNKVAYHTEPACSGRKKSVINLLSLTELPPSLQPHN